MKTTNLQTETDNLVLFPSAKNFKMELELSDPMVDLLTEYSDLSDSDIPGHLDDRFERDQEMNAEVRYGSLDEFMNRNKTVLMTEDDKLSELIDDRMQAIAEAKARIKFYLAEIEMFLPRRR